MFDSIAVGLTLGFAGSLHCVGMCGGIVSALSLSPSTSQRWLAPLLYSLGRITTYTILGIALSAVGMLVVDTFAIQWVLKILAAAFLILMGGYLLMSLRPLHSLEALGYHIWRWIRPLAARMTILQNPGARFVCGMLWGFLPCGMIYGALALALATQDPTKAGLLMVSFGLGTMPAIIGAGWLGTRLTTSAQRRWIQIIGGLLLIGYGIYGFYHVFTGPIALVDHAFHMDQQEDYSGHTIESPSVAPDNAMTHSAHVVESASADPVDHSDHRAMKPSPVDPMTPMDHGAHSDELASNAPAGPMGQGGAATKSPAVDHRDH